jgi:hypothetical protein
MTDKEQTPRLRTVNKVQPPFALNEFPNDFGLKLGKEIVCLLATKQPPSLEGSEWEQIFANCINGKWKPSNVGLDDVTLGNCAWGAKTVKSGNPEKSKLIRLISGRNSPSYSFNQQALDADPEILGKEVLAIWNNRVSAVRSKFAHVRTVVLIKSNDLTKLVVFEIETVLYPADRYFWIRNKRNNLEGYERETKFHKFTWQPHGSQFTIIETVPNDTLLIKVKSPPVLEKIKILEAVNFDNSWISVTKRKTNA